MAVQHQHIIILGVISEYQITEQILRHKTLLTVTCRQLLFNIFSCQFVQVLTRSNCRTYEHELCAHPSKRAEIKVWVEGTSKNEHGTHQPAKGQIRILVSG